MTTRPPNPDPSAVAPADSRSERIADWLERARQGDAAARDQLFAATRSFVATAARFHLQRRLQAKVDASDIVQQSLLEAHRGFDGFSGESPGEWLAWLKRIVVHNALDAAKAYRGTAKRDAGREVALAAHDDASGGWHASAIDPADSPSVQAALGERELIVAAALDALPEDHREVLLLRNMVRLPFEEVGQRMGRSAGACRMLWMRAIANLRDTLPPSCAGE
jgi:RNA polymerase sigma-70 factor (ECF subfamily)